MDNGIKRCCVCGKIFEGWGNNPWPVKEEGRCCDECNRTAVVPARLQDLVRRDDDGRTN